MVQVHTAPYHTLVNLELDQASAQHGHTWPRARAIALLRVDPTRSSEAGTVRGLRWHNLEGKEGGVGS